MSKKSAGILLYRFKSKDPEFLLAHPGGPFWSKKDLGAWSLPKGEFEEEDPLDAAVREFEEETGQRVAGDFIALKPVKSKGGKLLIPFGLESDFEPHDLKSNTFRMEWPPKTGRMNDFPEVDRVEWFGYELALQKANDYQRPVIVELMMKVRLK